MPFLVRVIRGGRPFRCAADENTTQPSAAKQPLFAAVLTIEQSYGKLRKLSI
jgi:hypothetical protein